MKNNYDTIKLKLHKEGVIENQDLNTWIYAYNRYADYVNENIEIWNYEHENYYSNVAYDRFFASKSSDLRDILSAETGMKFVVDDLQFIGITKNGGKIYIG